MFKSRTGMPVNTLEDALRLAQILARAMASGESKEYRSYRLFSALTDGGLEALAAFFVWRARGQILKELGEA